MLTTQDVKVTGPLIFGDLVSLQISGHSLAKPLQFGHESAEVIQEWVDAIKECQAESEKPDPELQPVQPSPRKKYSPRPKSDPETPRRREEKVKEKEKEKEKLKTVDQLLEESKDVSVIDLEPVENLRLSKSKKKFPILESPRDEKAARRATAGATDRKSKKKQY